MTHKTCRLCGESLPATLEYFYSGGRGDLAARCKKCHHVRLPKPTREQRFWRHVPSAGVDECWVWSGANNEKYGSFYLGPDRGLGSAHRYSYELHYGPVPTGHFVCHSCDNPRCVNPRHLWVGTRQDNHLDMLSKGRGGFGKYGFEAKRRKDGTFSPRDSGKETDEIGPLEFTS